MLTSTITIIKNLGATSAKGMQLVRETMVEGLQLRSGSPPWQDEAGENSVIEAGSPDDRDIEVDNNDVVDGEKDVFGHAIDARSRDCSRRVLLRW